MVLSVFLDLPWLLRRAAAKSLSAIVAHNPQWSDVIIGGLGTAVERSEFNARAVMEALQCVATPSHPQKEALAVSVLLLAHYPKIGRENNSFLKIHEYLTLCLLQLLLTPAHGCISFVN